MKIKIIYISNTKSEELHKHDFSLNHLICKTHKLLYYQKNLGELICY